MDPIEIDPEIMGGTPCFAGTRVPISTLFDYLQHGRPPDEFLDHFPSVRREQSLRVLEMAGQSLLAGLPSTRPASLAGAAGR